MKYKGLMRDNTEDLAKSGADADVTLGYICLALIAVGVPFGIYALFNSEESRLVVFDVAAGSFALLGASYIYLRGLRGMAWVSISVLVTIEALVGFLLVPVWQFVTGKVLIDESYTYVMLLVLTGFAAFWIGSLVIRREAGLNFAAQVKDTPERVVFISAIMLAIGGLANLLLWKAGLYSYTSSAGARESSLAFLQWLTFPTNLLTAALVVSAIEVLAKRSANSLIRIVFWLSLLLSIGFGVISGMKSGPLYPLLYISLVYIVANKRMPRAVLLLPVFVVLFIYPFVTAYRNNLKSGYRSQINTTEGLQSALIKSFDDAFLSLNANSPETQRKYTNATVTRLSYLTYVRDVYTLSDPTVLNGKEKVWLSPIYPLVPRFLWKDKPVLNKGQRLSIALGGGPFSSAAITLPGDLYSMYGIYGVIAGMLTWGLCLQLFMNWLGHKHCSEKSLFFYAIMLPQLLNCESDVVGLVAGTVQLSIIWMFLSFIIYGRLASPIGVAKNQRLKGAL